MSLPLMLGSEVFQTAPEPSPATMEVVQGCQCSYCLQAQPVGFQVDFSTMEDPAVPRPLRADVATYQRGKYDNSEVQSGAIFQDAIRWRIPGTLQVCDETGRSQWTYDEELPCGTLICTTGSNRGARWVPDGVENGRIRGRYTLNSVANSSLAGSERWLDPGTGTLYDTAIDPVSSNSGFTRRLGGTWCSPFEMLWEAT